MYHHYLDFEIKVDQAKDSQYPVDILQSPAGEIRGVMQFPLSEIELQNRLLMLENVLLRSGGRLRWNLTPQEQAIQDFGSILFDALFNADLRTIYFDSRRIAESQEKGLRIKLRIQPAELAVIPWEYLYDARNAEYVCLSKETPIVRYPEVSLHIKPLKISAPVRILGIISDLKDPQLEALDISSERQKISKATQSLTDKKLIEWKWLESPTWRDIQAVMRQGPWHILHYIGHGGFDQQSEQGTMILRDHDGRPSEMEAIKLARLLADHPSLRLVILNSCNSARGSQQYSFSSIAATLIRRGIPSVLAMQYAITDTAAIEFSQSFYESISDMLPVDTAVAEARKAMSIAINNSFEWGIPVLYMRTSSGEIFDFERTNLSDGSEVKPQKEFQDGESSKSQQSFSVSNREELLIPRIVSVAVSWSLPLLDDILNDWTPQLSSHDEIRQTGCLLRETLKSFDIPIDFAGAYIGSVQALYLMEPGHMERAVNGEIRRSKVEIRRLKSLIDDLALERVMHLTKEFERRF